MLWCATCRTVGFVAAAACGRCGTPLESLTERSLVGWELAGRYRIERLLGCGGMGAVYAATQLKLHRGVAVKVLLPQAALDESLRQRFLREAELAGKLRHPGIVETIDFDVSAEGLPFLVMELLEGGRTLRRVLDAHPEGLPLPVFATFVAEIGGALEAAHRSGVVHRDLKPENVMLVPYADGTERLKLLDFGLARLLAESGSFALTTSSVLLGSPFYMAPEQFRGEPTDARTDLYALGVMAFELLTGKPPFPARSLGHLAHQHLHAAPPDLRERGVPEPLASAVARAMAKDPAERFRDARSFCEAVEKASGGAATVSTMVLAATAAAPEAPPDPGRESSPTVQLASRRSLRRPARRWRRAARAAAAALVAGAVLLAALLLRRENARPDPASAAGFRAVDLPAAALRDMVAVGAPKDRVGLLLFRAGSVSAWTPREGLVSGLPLSASIARRVPSADGDLWLAGADGRSLHRFDRAARRIAESVALPSFLSAAVLGPGRIGLLLAAPPRFRVVDKGGRTLSEAPLDALLSALALAPDGSRVALFSPAGISLRKLPGLEAIGEIRAEEPILQGAAASFSFDGKRLAFGFRDVSVWEIDPPRRVARLQTEGWPHDIGWLPDGTLTTVDERGTLHVAVDPAAGWSFEVPSPAGTYTAAFDSDALRWAVAGRDGVRLWEVCRPAPVMETDLRRLETWSIAPDARGALLAVSGKDRDIALVLAASGKPLGTLRGHRDGVPMVRFAPDGRLLSASDDGTLRVWDARARKLERSVEGHRSLVNAVAFVPGEKAFVSAGSDNAVKLWRWPELSLLRELARTPNAGASAAFLPGDPRTLLVGDWSGNALLLTGPELREEARLAVPGAVLYALCATRQGWWAASFGEGAPGTFFLPRAPFGSARRVAPSPVFACAPAAPGQTAFLERGRIVIREDATTAVARTIHFSPDGGAALVRAADRLVVGVGEGRLRAFALSP